MNDILKTYMERFRENRHTLRRYTAFVLALAMITTLFVNWQLHGVGISMTAQYQCGEEEHTHTADCYTKVLTCGYNEGDLENAAEVAAAEADQPSAEDEIMPLSLEPQIEFVPHEHTDDCYTEVQTLTCMEEEHVHGDDCFDPEDGSLICDKFEHTHDENCYTTEYELTCGLEEGELVEQVVEPTQSAALAAMAAAEPVALAPMVDTVEPIYHHHTDACYEEVLTCPLPEHQHTVACLSDTSADLETPEEWQAANAEAVVSGNWAEDLVSVAKTQLGYEQSEKNFEIDPADGVTLRYYSRYGQSYGNPYGEWDVMFLSYCLKYAGIPQSVIPQEASVLALRSSMSDMEWLLGGEDGSSANVGDIVIYNKYVTRTVAVDSSADGAADGLDDLFSMDAEGENGAEPEESGAAALDTAPAADSVTTPDTPDTANPDQTAAKPVDSTDTAVPSVVSPAAEPQTTTVTDAQPVETVGIVSSVDSDADTLTVISGDVDGKVAEVALSTAEVLGVVSVAYAQYADEMLSSAVDGALRAPMMLAAAGDSLTAIYYVDYFDETKVTGTGGITETTVTVNGNAVTGNLSLNDNDKLQLDYDFYIPADVLNLETGNNILTYHLPDGVVPTETKTFALEDNKGTMTVQKDGTIILTFNNNFEPHKPFTGKFYLNAKVKTDKIGDGGTIKFPGSSASITVNNPRGISIDKKGTYDEKDDKRILHYTVTVSSSDGWDELIHIDDQLDNTGKVTGKYLQNTIKLTDKNGKKIDLADYLTWGTAPEQSFSIKDLPKMNAGDKYILTYDVELSGSYGGSGSGSFHNSAWTNDEQKTDPWIWHSNYIDKQGSYNNEDGYMYWTVTLSNYYGGSLKGYKVTDALQTNGATIVGDVTISEKSKDGTVSPNFDTITNVNGASKFDYTFTKDAEGTEYTFYYKTTVPAGATTVKNDSTVETDDGDKYDASAEPGITDRSWSVSKSTSGSLIETSTPNLLKAPWKIEVVVPNNWSEFIIRDNIKNDSPDDAPDKITHYGIAADLQTEIEEKLQFTLVDNTTLSYAEAKKAGIDISIRYCDTDRGFDDDGTLRKGAKEIASTDTTSKVRAICIKLTKTAQYTGKNIKKLTLENYHTYVDVTNVAPGETVKKIRNQANNNDAYYSYTKPKEHTKFEKGVSTDYAGQWSAGNFVDKLEDVNYKESGRYFYYQLTLDTSDLTEFTENEYTVTDKLPAGLKYVEGSAKGAFRRPSDNAAYYDFYRDYDPWFYTDGIQKFSFDDATHLDKFFEVSATTYSSTEGQTLTFKIKNLLSLNNNTEHNYFKESSGFYIRYKVEVDTDLWKNWNGTGIENDSKDERTYINTAHWGDLDAKAEVTLKRKTENLKKDAEQLKDEYGNKIGSAAYTIKINPGAKDLIPDSDTVTLTDTLTVQQGFTAELDLDSVQLYDAADTTFSNPLSRDEYTFRYTSHVDAASVNTYTMELTVPDQRALVLKYTYKTSAGINQSVKLDNHAVLGGKWEAKDGMTLQDMNGGGHISQSKLVVHKVDSANQANGLKDAKFSLHWFNPTTSSWETTSKQHFTSDEAGKFTIYIGDKDLEAKHDTLYKLVEEEAPDGYRKTSKTFYFIFPSEGETDAQAYAKALGGKASDVNGNALPLLADSNLMICIFNEQSDLYIPNERSQLIIRKFWTNQYNEATAPKETSVTVKLYKYAKGGNRTNGTPVQTITLDNANNWTFTYNNVEEGYLYYIEEASTGSKYEVTYSDSNKTGVENGGMLTLTNKEKDNTGYELPSTGGTGTLPFTAVGGIMMLSALAYSFIHRKRRREGRADD